MCSRLQKLTKFLVYRQFLWFFGQFMHMLDLYNTPSHIYSSKLEIFFKVWVWIDPSPPLFGTVPKICSFFFFEGFPRQVPVTFFVFINLFSFLFVSVSIHIQPHKPLRIYEWGEWMLSSSVSSGIIYFCCLMFCKKSRYVTAQCRVTGKSCKCVGLWQGTLCGVSQFMFRQSHHQNIQQIQSPNKQSQHEMSYS